MKFEIVKKLEEELEKLNRELRVELPKELQKAAAYGDLSENAEYDAAKQRKQFVESRISQLQKRISEITSINVKAIPKDRVGLGSRLILTDLNSGEEMIYTFVFPEEVDPEKGKISLASPVGKSLIGKEEGDEVTVITPKGNRKYEIVELKTLHDLNGGNLA
ncbi:MAG: transcription elongation factor GreA [Nitrospinota bacterium]|nr:transcription elongation factor GreA [Nitrospinota bacterium]